VLVFRSCALGDFIVTLPLLARLPGALVVAHGEHLALARAGGLRCAGLDADGPGVHPLFAAEPQRCALAPALRARLESGEEVLLLGRPGPGRDALARALDRLGASRVHGRDPLPPPGVHAADHLLGALGEVPPGSAVPRLAFARAAARQRLAAVGLDPARPIAALHPGAGGRAKCWPAARWAEVARRLGVQVVLVVGPADEAAAREFGTACAAPCLQDLPLVELARALAGCDALLGHDSGVSHLAAALGVPVLALFGPSDPRRWAPRGPRVEVLTPSAGSDDLRELGVDAVTAAARSLLQSTTSR
jgi:ADP-heptose:LPS heptosyltransferase